MPKLFEILYKIFRIFAIIVSGSLGLISPFFWSTTRMFRSEKSYEEVTYFEMVGIWPSLSFLSVTGLLSMLSVLNFNVQLFAGMFGVLPLISAIVLYFTCDRERKVSSMSWFRVGCYTVLDVVGGLFSLAGRYICRTSCK